MTPRQMLFPFIATPQDIFDKNRMVFYYLGLFSNIFAFAILVESTGGLLASPFTAIMVALVLTGQQLSRFKSQSRWLIAIGLMSAGAFYLYEWFLGIPPAPEAPKILAFF